jgi:uncharacterized C2H2 Zn-finger protein
VFTILILDTATQPVAKGIGSMSEYLKRGKEGAPRVSFLPPVTDDDPLLQKDGVTVMRNACDALNMCTACGSLFKSNSAYVQHYRKEGKKLNDAHSSAAPPKAELVYDYIMNGYVLL